MEEITKVIVGVVFLCIIVAIITAISSIIESSPYAVVFLVLVGLVILYLKDQDKMKKSDQIEKEFSETLSQIEEDLKHGKISKQEQSERLHEAADKRDKDLKNNK